MPLFTNKNKSLTAIEQLSFKEKEIQAIVEANLETIFGLKLISSEFTVANFRLDSLAFDEDNNSFVIIEYKKGSSYSVVDQGCTYLSAILDNKAECVLKYNEETRQQLTKNNIDWASSRVIFISPSFNTYQKNSINLRNMPFELWEISMYENDIIGIEQCEASSNKSIKQSTTNSNEPTVAPVLSKIKVPTEQDHVDRTSKSIKSVWKELKSRLENYPATSFSAKPSYISWKKGITICYIKFYSDKLKIEVIRGSIYPNGKKSKGFFTLKEDPKKLARETSYNKATAEYTRKEYSITLNKTEDINYVIFLLDQKYNSMG